MAVNDPVADVLARIRNALGARKETVRCLFSNPVKSLLDLMKREGYIGSYKEEEVRKGVKELVVELKYFEGEPVIKMMKRISTPGRRVYAPVEDLPRVSNGLGIAVLSTSRGVMTDQEARSQNIGGEVWCCIY